MLKKGDDTMKKIIVAGLFVGVLLLSVGAAGSVYAQMNQEERPEAAWGGAMVNEGERPFRHNHEMMGAYRTEGGEPGMRGGFRLGTPGLMHEYVLKAFAEAVGLTPEQVQERMTAGETHRDIAQSQGFSEEEIPDLLLSFHAEALAEMVSDGVIIQEQADRMLERKSQMRSSEYGPGSCNGEGTRQGHHGGGRGLWGN